MFTEQCSVALLNVTGDALDPLVIWLSKQPSAHLLP